MPQYSVNNVTVENVLGFIKNKEIATPEIQRPFVWKSDQIRDLIDSLYNGYPIGYLIIWQNPDTIDKNGAKTIGRKIMIDGQQRITALMSSILGLHVLDKNFTEKVHKISFNPYAALAEEPCFEVQSAAILKDKKWVKDISFLFSGEYNSFDFIPKFCNDNPDIEPQQLNQLIEKVRDIRNAPIGVINLDKSLSIDKVTEIFIRINSKGASLTQADFVMSTIAADDKYGGNLLRKAIDYFCHLCTDSKFISVVNQDESFKTTEYYPMIKWAETVSKPLFTLTFDDLLRIAFSSRYYDQFVECLTSAGFVHRKLIRGRMATDFAYTLFLRLRENKEIEKLKVAHYVQKWYVMSILTGRYTSSPETQMDFDLRSIREKGFLTFFNEVMANLSDSFWNVTLVQKLDTSTSNSPAFAIYLAAQCKNVDNSFLSNGAKVRDLLNETADNHHIFPRQYLKDQNMDNSTIYNQIANFVYLSRPVNIAIGKKAPHVYLGEIVNAINTTTKVSTNSTPIFVKTAYQQILSIWTVRDIPNFYRSVEN